MIHHAVFFRLKHPAGSAAERDFLQGGQGLAEIPSVRDFRVLRQVSPKNAFALGYAMAFDDEAGYRAYDEHPYHERYVRERWIPEVEDFLEIDYVPYEPATAPAP